MDEHILAKWQEIKSLVEELELDVVKNAKGNASAGIRVRKGLRHMKTLLGEQIKLSLNVGKK
jgi:hypothetical protein